MLMRSNSNENDSGIYTDIFMYRKNRGWKKHHAPTLLAFLTDIIGLAALRHDFGQTEMQQVSLKLYLTFVSDL